jgi:hypothetical protein
MDLLAVGMMMATGLTAAGAMSDTVLMGERKTED